MLKVKVNIQVLKVDSRLITLFKHFFRGKEIKTSEMSILFKNFGPYGKLRTANWPIAWRKQTQPYNIYTYRFHIQSIYVVLLLNLAEKNICFFCEKIHSSMHHTHTRLKFYNIPSICMCNQMVTSEIRE